MKNETVDKCAVSKCGNAIPKRGRKRLVDSKCRPREMKLLLRISKSFCATHTLRNAHMGALSVRTHVYVS